MNKLLSFSSAAVALLALHLPTLAAAACDQTGHIYSLATEETGTATLQLRLGGPAATQVFAFAINDKMVLDAAMAALPGRTRVKVHTDATAVCSTAGGAAPVVTSLFVTP